MPATAAARAFCGASFSAASAAAWASAAFPAASDASASARFDARWPALFAAASRHAAIAPDIRPSCQSTSPRWNGASDARGFTRLRVAKTEHGVDRAAFALMAAAALEPLPVPGRRHHERRRFIASRTVAGVSRERARPRERTAKALQHAQRRPGDRSAAAVPCVGARQRRRRPRHVTQCIADARGGKRRPARTGGASARGIV